MDAQVIVVGAGPVGLLLAGELRLGGARVVVLERLAEATTESRASTLHARTMEMLDQRGLVEALGPAASQRMGHFGGIPLDLGALDTRYPGQWKVSQSRVEEVLARWAGGLGADIRRGHEVVGLAVTHDGVRVQATGPAGPVELTAGYLVGCDGEHSTVRRLAGIPLAGSQATRALLRADVAGIQVADRRFERLPGGLAIAGRLPSGATRVMVGEFVPPAARAAPASFAQLCQTWQRVTGEDLRGGTPLWVNAFDNASLLATRYRDGRVLLAGDAAHRQLPAGGQAINLGLQDAANLGWKLAADVSGSAPPGLLDSYHDERHETGRRVLRNIEAQSLLLLGEPGVEPLRTVLAELIDHPPGRDLLAGTITGLDVRYEPGGHPLVGARMPHVPLHPAGPAASGPAATSTAALLRSGRGVLLDLSGRQDRAARLRRLAGRARRVDFVAAAGALGGVDAVLLRPDGYVAWAAPAPDGEPAAALRRWFGRRPPRRGETIPGTA